jgi:SPX domain protein involved in polyphosphate accumulation
MKYGQHLKDNIAPDYGPDPYLDYDKLKQIIRRLSEKPQARYDDSDLTAGACLFSAQHL